MNEFKDWEYKRDLFDLDNKGFWSKSIKDNIVRANGSIQHIDIIPKVIRNRYKTVWEISQKTLIQLSIDRSPFICQTQSLNLWFPEPNMKNLTSALFFGWKNQLKTGCYYVRSQPKRQAQQFSLDIQVSSEMEKTTCSIFNPEGCMAFSS